MSKTIGAYSVIERLTGDGEAYVARSADGRTCTLRVVGIPPDDERVERAKVETFACAALHHPAVGLIADLFGHEGKTVIVGPAPLDGSTLAQLVERAASADTLLEPPAIWHIGLQICAALSLAHATEVEGDFIPVCHGHLGPEHVSVGFDGSVRVEGLGLGPLVGEDGIPSPAGFTAPEQEGGGRVTPRGDLYALGAIIWHLLTGDDPIPGMSADDVTVPTAFQEPFSRALEPKVGKRRITSMELEQFFKELAGNRDDGKRALADAMSLLKRGATLLGHVQPERKRTSQPPQLKRAGKLGGALGGRGPGSTRTPVPGAVEVPPLRSKQDTLLGATPPPRPRMDSTKPIDWDAASKSASDTISPPAIHVVDELSWGVEEEADSDGAPRQGSLIADEDSDGEEMTMMNVAGAELRAAMDKKARRRASAGKMAAASEDESTLVRSRRKLERRGLSGDESEVDSDEGEDVTVMRSQDEMPAVVLEARKRRAEQRDSARGRAMEAPTPVKSPATAKAAGPATSKTPPLPGIARAGAPPLGATKPGATKPGAGPKPGAEGAPRPADSGRGLPRPADSGRGLPRPRGSDAGEGPRELPRPRSSDRGAVASQPGPEPVEEPKASSNLLRTLASAGVDDDVSVEIGGDEPSDDGELAPPPSRIDRPIIDIGESSPSTKSSSAEPRPDRAAPARAASAGASAPDAREDDEAAPKVTEPKAAAPKPVEPAAAEPAKPEPAKPEPAKPEPAKPEPAKPAAAKPAAAEPATAATAKPAAAKPAVASTTEPVGRDAEPVEAQPASTHAGSPWTHDEQVAADGPKPLPKGLAALIMVGTAVVVMVVGVLWVRHNANVGPTPSEPNGGPSAAPSASAPSGPNASQPRPALSPAPSSSAEPAASASGAPSASSAAPEPEPPSVDASRLPMTMGYLVVQFPTDPAAVVSLQGKDIGKVGEPSEVACGRAAFVRLKSSDGRWLTGGQTVTIKCQAVTTIEAKP